MDTIVQIHCKIFASIILVGYILFIRRYTFKLIAFHLKRVLLPKRSLLDAPYPGLCDDQLVAVRDRPRLLLHMIYVYEFGRSDSAFRANYNPDINKYKRDRSATPLTNIKPSFKMPYSIASLALRFWVNCKIYHNNQ